MAWRRPGDKLLSESVVVSLPTQICVTWLQLVNQVISMTSEEIATKFCGDLMSGSDFSVHISKFC